MTRTLLIAHGGGPTAVINASLYGALIEARRSGAFSRILASKRGIASDSFIDLTDIPPTKLALLPSTPGSAIGTDRTPIDQEGYAALAARFHDKGITDIRLAVTRNIREFFLEDPVRQKEPSIKAVWDLMCDHPTFFDPRQYMTPLMETMRFGTMPTLTVEALMKRVKRGVKEAVSTLIVQFGSVNKASLVAAKSLEEMADHYRKEGI